MRDDREDYLTEELEFSHFCEVMIYAETDICSKCGKHCIPIWQEEEDFEQWEKEVEESCNNITESVHEIKRLETCDSKDI